MRDGDDTKRGEASGWDPGDDGVGSISDAEVARLVDALDHALRAGTLRADGRAVASPSATYVITRR